jgi:hypothetical protein
MSQDSGGHTSTDGVDQAKEYKRSASEQRGPGSHPKAVAPNTLNAATEDRTARAEEQTDWTRVREWIEWKRWQNEERIWLLSETRNRGPAPRRRVRFDFWNKATQQILSRCCLSHGTFVCGENGGMQFIFLLPSEEKRRGWTSPSRSPQTWSIFERHER